MECCPETLPSIPQEAFDSFSRGAVLWNVMEQLQKLRGGKYMLHGLGSEGRHLTATQEAVRETLEVPEGMVLECSPKGALRNTMPVKKLATLLRATFEKLGIEAELLELDQGVWISEKTLGNMVQWSRRQPWYEDVPNEPELTTWNAHSSTGPRTFAMTFDKLAKAQELSR